MNMLRYAISLVLQAWSALSAAASEASAELWASWFKWSGRARAIGSHAAVGVGDALAAPAAVLDGAASLVGNLLPQRAVTAAQVADAAVAEDEAVQAVAPAPRPLTLPELVQLHAAALPQGVDAVELPELPHAITVWLSDMGPDNRRFLAKMPIASIERHIGAAGPSHLIRGIAPVPTAADMRQRQADIAEALAGIEADGQLDRMRAEMLSDTPPDTRDDAYDITARGPAFA